MTAREALPADFPFDEADSSNHEQQKASKYELETVLKTLEKMTTGFALPARLEKGLIPIDPVVERLLEAYALLREEFAYADRDVRIMDMALQGCKPNEILEAIGAENFVDKAGNPSEVPIRQINNIQYGFPTMFNKSKTKTYGPANMIQMLNRYDLTRDPESISLPATKPLTKETRAAKLAKASEVEYQQMDKWLRMGLGELDAKTIRSLGKALLGVPVPAAKRKNVTRANEVLLAKIESARDYTYENTEHLYSRQEYKDALTFKPDEAQEIMRIIRNFHGEGDGQDIYSDVKGKFDTYSQNEMWRRRATVTHFIARIMVISA